MKRYKVILTKAERQQLEKLISSGIASARKLTRARILLKVDEGLGKTAISQALDGEAEAHLIAMACSAPPEGRERWTLRLLQSEMIKRQHVVDEVSHETIRTAMKKTFSGRG